jgi:hypothetical protein
MRKKLLLLIAGWMISSLWGAGPGLAQSGCTVTVAGAGSYSTGSNVILTSTTSGTCQPISQVSYYNGTTLLGSSSAAPTYSFTWDTTGVSVGTYNNVFATAFFAGSAGSGSTVIDMVGSPAAGPNPAQNTSFGGSYAASWLPGDDQMCTSNWPYNGSTSSLQDGTCEWTGSTTPPASAPPPPLVEPPSTLDALDNTMHTLSDFVNFANSFLGQSIGSLSTSIDTWYPQVAQWISSTCDDGSSCDALGQCSDGTQCGRLLSLTANLNAWNTVITSWMGQNYTNAAVWCVPPEATLLNGNSSTNEDTYINSNSGTTTWGDLPHVISCLNYNSNPSGGTASNSSVFNYQQCVTALTSGTCPGGLPAQCSPLILGRSLLGTVAPAYDGCTGNYWTWASSSLTLAIDDAPKFALRGAFLTDIYNRAKTMQTIFPAAATALQNFLTGPAAQLIAVAPCDDGSACTSGNCADGTACAPSPTVSLPNSVIYGWVDALPGTSGGGCTDSSNNRVGCAHIVKVTAYAAARNGSSSNGTNNGLGANAPPLQSVLPWIKTSVGLITRSFTLQNRDGLVYVSVRRWDQDHSSSIFFPNGHPLWQFSFHNPNSSVTTGQGLPSQCFAPGFGFGLEPTTIAGLNDLNGGISMVDQKSLNSAFMLNDEGTGPNKGKVDPNAATDNAEYLLCLSLANGLLATAPESHACVEYIASSPSSDSQSVINGSSQDGDADYSLKFVSCNSVKGFPPPDDLAYSSS